MAATMKAKSTPPAAYRRSATHYTVESTSRTLDFYNVRLGRYAWECECEGFHYRRSCQHVGAVIAAERGRIHEEQRAGRSGLKLEDLFADMG
jgi:hypothetical protein